MNTTIILVLCIVSVVFNIIALVLILNANYKHFTATHGYLSSLATCLDSSIEVAASTNKVMESFSRTLDLYLKQYCSDNESIDTKLTELQESVKTLSDKVDEFETKYNYIYEEYLKLTGWLKKIESEVLDISKTSVTASKDAVTPPFIVSDGYGVCDGNT